MSRAAELLSSPLGLHLLDLISQRDAARLTDGDLTELLGELHIRFRSDYEEHVALLRSQAARLTGLAEWLARRMPGWWDGIDRGRQVWVGRSPDPPEPDRLLVDLSFMHSEAPKPKSALWTSTLSSSVSPWLGHDENLYRGPSTVWLMTVAQIARVAEIHSPAGWMVGAGPTLSPGRGRLHVHAHDRTRASARRARPGSTRTGRKSPWIGTASTCPPEGG